MLSLPQRGESVPQMWNYDYHRAPVENFEGHSDVVKEFVWRTKDVGDPNGLLLFVCRHIICLCSFFEKFIRS